jgi:HTH-type transcriptional regulator / antitoxin HigA
MTITFNPENYSKLLIKYQPKPIRTELENERALSIVEELMSNRNRNPEENEFYDLLVTLIEKFERDFYVPGKGTTPHGILNFLMEQQNLNEKDLVGIIGSEEVVAEVVKGKREMTTI